MRIQAGGGAAPARRFHSPGPSCGLVPGARHRPAAQVGWASFVQKEKILEKFVPLCIVNSRIRNMFIWYFYAINSRKLVFSFRCRLEFFFSTIATTVFLSVNLRPTLIIIGKIVKDCYFVAFPCFLTNVNSHVMPYFS